MPAGIVDHAIETSVLTHGDLDDTSDVLLLGHVAVHESSASASSFNLGHGCGACLVITVGNDDVGSVLRQHPRAALPDALGPAGDDGNLVFQFHGDPFLAVT